MKIALGEMEKAATSLQQGHQRQGIGSKYIRYLGENYLIKHCIIRNKFNVTFTLLYVFNIQIFLKII